MKNKKQSPWRDEKGNLLSIEKIKILSKGWNRTTWEQYLRDTVNIRHKELNLNNARTVENYSIEQHKNFYNIPRVDLKRNPKLKKEMKAMVNTLPNREQTIITMIYWNGLSIREVARRLNRPRSSVRRWHEGALKYLGNEILRIINLGSLQVR